MASRRLSRVGAQLVLLLVVLAVAASAATIDISTSAANASNWLITGAGATNAAAVVDSNLTGGISITTTGNQTGTFITGGSLANFNGFWEAVLSFSIPAGATNISANFSGLTADDRTVLELGPTALGNESISGAGAGVMYFTSGTSSAYNFTQVTSGDFSSSLAAGGNYTLELLVNNTGTGVNGDPERTFQTASDATAVTLSGSITYTAATGVPEPTSLSYLLIGAIPLALGFARRRRAK
jgi:hypothetical protein